MTSQMITLRERMAELRDLAGVIGLASWDQETFLPRKAEAARASQLATLQGIYHERLIDPALGELLAWAQDANSATSDEKAMARVLADERFRAVKVPAALVKALAEAQSQGVGVWREAREADRFADFQPALERLLSLRREEAEALGYEQDRYDALLEKFEPGMRVARLTPVLYRLRDQLIPWVQAIAATGKRVKDPFAGHRFDKEAQWPLLMRALGDMGFDLEAGRQDVSSHPFSGGSHPCDVRLTTRIHESQPLSALSSTLHEGGHGLYEQGFNEAHFRTPLANAPSMGLHESQSRLWENMVGKSRPFWRYFFAPTQAAFAQALGGMDEDDFHVVVNQVTPSLIRTEADEVTYNLHIVLRYELELALLRGSLPVAELPAAWNERMERYLGLRPRNDAEGVLQDIHWSMGEFGYFPTYALGNLYAASLFRTAQARLPDLETRIGRGDLRTLRQWLRENVHQEGYRLPAEALIEKVTGRGLTDEDFLSYLRSKYGALYGLSL